MNDRWLRSFLTVAQAGSITAAARELFISPQALLQQLNLLEAEIGFKVFARKSTGCVLTAPGREFYKGILRQLEIYNETIRRCHRIEASKASIRIPFMSSIVTPEFIERIRAAYNAADGTLKVHFIQTDVKTSDWIDGLVREEYDVIEHYTIDGYVPEGIYFQKLYDVNSWCLMHPEHPLAGKESIQPRDLNGCTIASNGTSLLRYLQLYLENTGIKVEFREIDSNRSSIIEACDMGNLCFLNENIAREFSGFVFLPLDFNTHVQSGLACHESMYPVYKPFFDAAIEVSKTFIWGE